MRVQNWFILRRRVGGTLLKISQPEQKQALARAQIRRLLAAPGFIQERLEVCDELVSEIVRKNMIDGRSSIPEQTFSSQELRRLSERDKGKKNI